MDQPWLKKVGNISDYLQSNKGNPSPSPVSFNRQSIRDDNDQEFRLPDSLIAVSPTGDVVVLAKRSRCCVLTRSSVSKTGKDYAFQLRTTIELSGAPSSSNDIPTCIACLPIASQKVSTHGLAEWTCIAVGYRSGLLQMYTENGVYLFGESFNNRPVVQMKCRTQHWLNTQCGNVAEPGDDFSILFADGTLVTIDGFGLFQLLRVVYAQQALRPSSSSMTTSIPHNMLSFTKWKFTDIDNVNDFVTCGIRPMTELSALFFATFQNGADISSCNQLSHFVTAGSMPFVGCWTGQERRQSQSLISDVTTAVTNKIVSSFTGLLSWSRQTDQQKYSSSTTDETNVAAEAPKALNLKSTILDRPRVGQCIAASPNHRLAAVSDNFNRVYVLDLELNVIIKQLKGYREAQIGWVRSVQDSDSMSSKHSESRNSRATQFLVIHSPRRCQLEIWGGERWERIHSTEVAPNSRLIYAPHGMLGWTRSLANDPIDCGLNSCFLLSSDGPIYAVEVAFHWAVADRNRAKLQDQSLLRELDNAIKAGKGATPFGEIVVKMQLDETRDSAVQLLVRQLQKSPSQLVNAITDLLPVSKRFPAEEGQRFHGLCSRALAAVNLFKNLEDLLSKHAATKSSGVVSNRPGVNLESILSTFSLKVNERDSYRQIFETFCLVNGMKIQEDTRQQSPTKPVQLVEFMELLGLLSKPGISQQSSDVLLGSYIFGGLFNMADFSDRSHQFESAISLFACQLFKPVDLLRFLLTYFFSPVAPWLAVEHLSLLVSLLQLLSRLTMETTTASSHEFWSLCHKMCADSYSHVKALTVALIASQLSSSKNNRPVASQEEQSSLLELTGDWESDISVSDLLLATDPNGPSLSNGADEWSQLCTQLTVLSLFEMLVSCRTANQNQQQQQQPAEDSTDGWDTDVHDIGVVSLPQLSSSMITNNGIDLLSEHVCRWVVASKFDIQAFFARVDIAAHGRPDFSLKLLTVDSTIDHLLARLILILPSSLSSDNIFAGCAWESAISWSRQELAGNQQVLLESSISYANLIANNAHLKCWLLQHIWAKLTRPVFENVFNTILRLDRSPRDNELGDGLTELSAEQLTLVTAQLFEMLMEVSNKCAVTPGQPKSLLTAVEPSETVWPLPSPDKGRISLANQAAGADVTLNNQACLQLHLETAIVMRIIIHFRMRPASMDHLFSHIEQSILFQDLFSAPTPPPHVLDYVTESRASFVIRVTKAILIAVKPPSLPFLLSNCPYFDQWNELSLRLVDFWHLDRSAIFGKQLAFFCSIGISEDLVKLTEKHSNEESFNAVRFWPAIIVSIGHQIARLVYQADQGARSQQLRNRLDAFTPELVQWLAECLNDQESIVLASAFGHSSASPSSLPVLSRLLSLSLAHLPESYSFYGMTLALCELVGTLQEESSF